MEINDSIVLTGYAAITARGDFSARGNSDGNFVAPKVSLGAIPSFDLKNYPVSKKTYLDRCSALALAGAALALQDAGISHPPADPARFGITLGTHWGCMDTMKSFWDNLSQKGAHLANPLLFSHSYFNSPISLCAIEFGLQGYHTTVCAGANSGLEAIRLAHDAIAAGHADSMLCGGVDALTAARIQMNHSDDDGEASVFFVLEKSSFAKTRDAKALWDIDPDFFDNAIKWTSNFGDCGAASSVLAVLQQISGTLV